MKFLFLKKERNFFKVISTLIAFSVLIAPISQTFKVQTAEAQWAVLDAANLNVNSQTLTATQAILKSTVINTKSNVSSAISNGELEVKEYVLDLIVWALINTMIEKMIQSVTQWVAGGFQGSPAFVEDLQGFVMGIADQVAGDFIYGSSLSALCSPFKLNIQAALAFQYGKSRTYEAKCTLTSVVNNVSNFMEGDFLSGGWNEWFKMTQTPSNNQYGALMEASIGMNATIKNAKGEEIKLLDFGKGLMSLKDAKGNIITPGTSIESTLNESLNTPGKRLTVADEIDELLGTLLSQLVSTALSSASGGLKGMGTSGSNATYWSGVSAQSVTQGSTNTSALFGTSISQVTENIGLQDTIISIITAMSTWKSSCDTGGLTPELSTYLSNAQAAKTTSTGVLSTINTYESNYSSLASGALSPTSYGVTTVAEAQSIVIDQYTTYENSGVIPSSQTNADLQYSTIPAVSTLIQNLQQFYEMGCITSQTSTISSISLQ